VRLLSNRSYYAQGLVTRGTELLQYNASELGVGAHGQTPAATITLSAQEGEMEKRDFLQLSSLDMIHLSKQMMNLSSVESPGTSAEMFKPLSISSESGFLLQ
jgi:hypothetical protein